MTLENIAFACHGHLFKASTSSSMEVAGVVLDSRQVEKNYLFIATVGERVDGHSFIDEVYEKGAMAVLCEKAPTNPKGPYILVENSFVALKLIAKWYREQLDIKIIGITGSVGKTTTKEFISSVVSRKYKVLKTEGNFNNEVGLPLTILKITQEHEVAVLEMGISDFGEMHRLSEIAQPDICVLTNIGLCHLDNLGSRQGILKAKSEIFDFMKEDGNVCINGDDDMLTTLSKVKGKKPFTFGLNSGNDVFPSHIVNKGLLGSSCTIHYKDRELTAHIPLPGEHMILNTLAATSIGLLLHMSNNEIIEGIASVPSVGGRSNIIRHESFMIIDDCYNANPISMKAAIDLLNLADTRKIAILGDMFELGDEQNNLHKEIGEYASLKNIDVLVCVGTLSLHMYEGALKDFKGMLVYYSTRDELIENLSSLIKQNDTILVKASHGMGFEHIVKALLN